MERKNGFTLIELLVVIAIIALLLSIIIPSLNKARMVAQEIICKSQIRQYGLATEMYTNDNDQMLPNAWRSLYAEDNFPGELQRFCRWHNPEYNLERYPEYAGPYWPYLSAADAHVCPLFAQLAPGFGSQHMEGNAGHHASHCIGGPFEPQFSYSMNAHIGEIRKDQVRSPSQTFLWAEENMWTLIGLSTYVLNDNALLVGSETNPTDSIGSFHKISRNQLSIQQETREYNTGVANVLLVDGSVTWLTPEDSIRYRGNVR